MSMHDNAVYGHGNFNLDVLHSGVFDNSDHACAFTVSGSAGTYSVDTAFAVVSGTHCKNGFPVLDGPVQGTAQIAYPPPGWMCLPRPLSVPETVSMIQ